MESLAHLRGCPSITVLDVQRNKIEDVEILEVLRDMPNLSCLYLQGNPVVNKVRNYRKRLIAMLPNLKYLDDRPVFENDRRCAEAFVQGKSGAVHSDCRGFSTSSSSCWARWVLTFFPLAGLFVFQAVLRQRGRSG